MCRNSVNVPAINVQYFAIIFACYLLLIEARTTHKSQLGDLLRDIKNNTNEETNNTLGANSPQWKFTPVDQSSAQSDETDSSVDEIVAGQVYDYDIIPGPIPKNLIDDTEEKRKPSEEELAVLHEAARLNFIMTFKEKMLSKLRMLTPPNVTDYHRFPQHVIDAVAVKDNPQSIDIQRDDPLPEHPDHYHAKITTSLRFAEKLPANKLNNMNVGQLPINTLYFPMPETIDDNNVEKATLYIFPEYKPSENSTVSHLSIYSNGRAKNSRLEKKLFESSNQHWEHIDITREVKSWVNSRNRNNYGITAQVQMSDGSTTPVIIPETFDTKERVPFIRLEQNDKQPRRRHKRSIGDIIPRDCTINGQDSRCCRYKFVLDFEELGSDFNFIITPRRFTANYCMGECPSYYLPASANGHLTAGLTRAKTTRCCTATELTPLNMVYVGNDGTISSGSLPGMAVARCGCE